jgi:hypothetical protein
VKQKIRFQGNDYLLISDHGGPDSGSIATQEQYDHFQESFAFLDADGVIYRYGNAIGTVEEIEFLKPS